MTRDEIDTICDSLGKKGNPFKARLISEHDIEQRQIIDEQVEENRGLRADVLLMQKANAEQRDLINRLQLEAQAHAQEARTANATIAEIYQAVSGGTGEPGNWHGAEPVRTVMQEQREEIRLLEEKLKGLCCAHGNALMQIHDKDKEIRLLSEQVNEANQELLRRADEITRLRGELSHWTFVRFKELEAENERLRMSLQGIIDIGKRDMTNPKYDGYFEAARQALTQEPT